MIKAEPAPRSLGEFRHYHLMVNIFVVVLLVSNLVAAKICQIGPFTLSGAQLLFPVTYIFGDIFTEVYGYSGSRRAIWIGFFASTLLAVMGMIVVALPPAPEWHDQETFAKVFGFVPRIVAASLIAFWAGEFANSFVLSKLKVITGGKHLWMRTIGSTVVGQAVDTALVIFLLFAGIQSVETMLKLIVSGYFGKVIYEAVATPMTYAVVNALKRMEGVDVFDKGVDFSPFRADS
ncbi:MAG: queuosine precursor transporter [Bryobacteraceae bacterium]